MTSLSPMAASTSARISPETCTAPHKSYPRTDWSRKPRFSVAPEKPERTRRMKSAPASSVLYSSYAVTKTLLQDKFRMVENLDSPGTAGLKLGPYGWNVLLMIWCTVVLFAD